VNIAAKNKTKVFTVPFQNSPAVDSNMKEPIPNWQPLKERRSRLPDCSESVAVSVFGSPSNKPEACIIYEKSALKNTNFEQRNCTVHRHITLAT